MAIIVELPPELGVEAAKRFALGGMAEVFTADRIFPQGGRTKLVVKQMLPQHLEHDELIGRFRDEARLGLRLRHSNIVRVLDYREIDDQHYMLMERIAGLDLSTIIQRCRRESIELPEPVTAFFLQGIASALAYMADATDDDGEDLELIHRDISPSNILVSHDGVIKLIDFGVARARERETRTATGVFVGKYSYMSPEQIRNEPMDIRSDLFALGSVGYELLTGRRAFQGESDFETFNLILDGGFAPIEELRPGVHPILAGAIRRCLAPDPAARYNHPLGLVEDLGEYMYQAVDRPPPLLAMEFVGRLVQRPGADEIEELEPDPTTTTASDGHGTAHLGPDVAETAPCLLVLDDTQPSTPAADDPTQLMTTPTPLPSSASLQQVAGKAGPAPGPSPTEERIAEEEVPAGEDMAAPHKRRGRAGMWLAGVGAMALVLVVATTVIAVVVPRLRQAAVADGHAGSPTTTGGGGATGGDGSAAVAPGKRDESGAGSWTRTSGTGASSTPASASDRDATNDDAPSPTPAQAQPTRDDREGGKPDRATDPGTKPGSDRDHGDDEATRKAEHLARLAAEQAAAEAAVAAASAAGESGEVDGSSDTATGAGASQTTAGSGAAEAQSRGELTLISNPWALVYIDGIPSGRTPAKNVTLTPGNHTVHLVNDDAGLELTFQVTITAGELTTVRKNLADP